ncbi:hypothetical protein EP7_004835 [Isosphaeraceae bacterium EP7]
MSRRAFAFSRLLAAAALCMLIVGCDGPTTGTATEAHDQDKSAGHMVHPAAGPNSPMAKKAAAKKAAQAPQ